METAIRLFNRLTEVEKMGIRGASPDRIAHLAYTAFGSDLPLMSNAERLVIVTETKALCELEFAAGSAENGFGKTWKF